MTTSASGAEDLLTPLEVARRARIKRRTVYRLIDRGELPAVKVGGQWRVPVAAVDALLTPARPLTTRLRGHR